MCDEDPADVAALHERLAAERTDPEDRVVRPVAQEGLAESGVHASIDSQEPVPTITMDGAWWHPVAVLGVAQPEIIGLTVGCRPRGVAVVLRPDVGAHGLLLFSSAGRVLTVDGVHLRDRRGDRRGDRRTAPVTVALAISRAVSLYAQIGFFGPVLGVTPPPRLSCWRWPSSHGPSGWRPAWTPWVQPVAEPVLGRVVERVVAQRAFRSPACSS